MYVSASNNGASLYAKFGFVGYSNAGQETTSMVRLGQLLGFGRSEGGQGWQVRQWFTGQQSQRGAGLCQGITKI